MTDLWTALTATAGLWLALAALTVLGLWLCAASAGEHDYPDRSRLDELDAPRCTCPTTTRIDAAIAATIARTEPTP